MSITFLCIHHTFLLESASLKLLDVVGFVKILHELWNFERFPTDILQNFLRINYLTRYSTIINLGEVL